jgi:hypothetical protein
MAPYGLGKVKIALELSVTNISKGKVTLCLLVVFGWIAPAAAAIDSVTVNKTRPYEKAAGYTYAEITCGSEGPINLSVRSVVAAHRVENDFSRETGLILRLISQRKYCVCGLGLFHLHYFAILVIPTLGTNAMLQARLLTIWTEGGLRCPQGIVRPTFSAASF